MLVFSFRDSLSHVQAGHGRSPPPGPFNVLPSLSANNNICQWPPSSRIQQIGPQSSNQSWAASLRDLMQRLRTSESNFVSAIPCFSSNSNSARAEATPFEPSAVPYIGDAAPVEGIELQHQVSGACYLRRICI